MEDYLKIANSGTAWVLCAITVAIAFVQALLYMDYLWGVHYRLQMEEAQLQR